jgi:hypothetical protein
MPTTAVNLTQPEETDVAIVLTASKPVSAGFISDLKQVASDAHAETLNVDVYVLQEAAIKRTKF